jgi:catechol-2,3-dioxygenase
MALKKLGHVVLKVRDLDRSEAFYTSVLGLAVTGGSRVAWCSCVPGTRTRTTSASGRSGRTRLRAASKQVGLFHVAWQVEREEDLGRFTPRSWRTGFRCG